MRAFGMLWGYDVGCGWLPETDAVETVWQAGCLKVDALGKTDRFGNLAADVYRVELDGGDILYESESYTAVRHFLEMLTEPYPEYKVA